MATGVASPNAQGQEITRIVMALSIPNATSPRKIIQSRAVINEQISTTGTNAPATLSAIFAMGAFEAEASDTICMILDKVVSLPVRVTLHFKKPKVLMVPPTTSSPMLLSMGMLSPVKALTFNALEPSITTPSTGTDIPGRSKKISPMESSATGFVTSFSPSKTIAVLGAKSISPFRALVVFPLE